MRFPLLLAAVAASSSFSVPLHAQIMRQGQVNQLYAQHCASCHGLRMEGAQAPSMLDDVWTHGGDDESLARSIRDGFPEKGMPAWKPLLSEEQIRTIVIYIREERSKAQRDKASYAKPDDDVAVKSKLHPYRLTTWSKEVQEPWSMTFLPDRTALVTEKRGRLLLFEPMNPKPVVISGLPEVDNDSQAGLFDITPHPRYTENGWLYLAYSHPREKPDGGRGSLTRVIRGKLQDNTLVEQQTIFEAPAAVYPSAGGVHFGGRLAFDRDGFLFFSIGERGRMTNAQDLSVPMGKVHRIHDDGRIPADNPFVNTPKAFPTIWSYGHRNPQGLAFDPSDGKLYDVEHGPRGGDELNWVRRGLNYGWPVITYGMNYNGTPISNITAKEGMEQPVTHWTPSLAVSGFSFYTADLFPKWKGHAFLASLAAQELRRLVLMDGRVVEQEVLFKDLGRMRHVLQGPDGALYVLFQDRIARIAP